MDRSCAAEGKRPEREKQLDNAEIKFVHLGNSLGVTHVQVEGEVLEVKRMILDMHRKICELRSGNSEDISIGVDKSEDGS